MKTIYFALAAAAIIATGNAMAAKGKNAMNIDGSVELSRGSVDLERSPNFIDGSDMDINRLQGNITIRMDRKSPLRLHANLTIMDGHLTQLSSSQNVSGTRVGIGASLLKPGKYNLLLQLSRQSTETGNPGARTDLQADITQLSASLYRDDINLNLGYQSISSDNVSLTGEQVGEFLQDADRTTVGLQYFLKNNAALILEKGFSDADDYFGLGFEYKFRNQPYGLLLSNLQGDGTDRINLGVVYHFRAKPSLRANLRSGKRWQSLVLDNR